MYKYILMLFTIFVCACNNNDDTPAKLYLEARTLVRQGKAEQAAVIFEQILIKYETSEFALKANEDLKKLKRINIGREEKPNENLFGDDGKVDYDTSLRSVKKLYNLKRYNQAEVILRDLIKEEPENNEYHYWLGNVSFKKRNMDLALKSYEKSANLQNNLAIFTLARYFFIKNDFISLRKHAQNLLKTQDAVLQANGRVFLAICQASLGHHNKAKEMIDNVNKSITNFSQVGMFYNYCLGLIHSKEKPAKAIEYFSNLMTSSDKEVSGKATLQMAQIYLRKKNFITEIEKLVQTNIQQNVKMAVVELLFDAGRNTEAKNLSNKVNEGNSNVESVKKLIALALRYQEIDYAYTLAKNAKRKFSKQIFFDTVLGDICIQKRAWALAYKYYENALKNTIDASIKLKIFKRLAKTAIMRRKENEALNFVEQALKIDPYQLELHFLLANVYLRQQNFSKVLDVYNQILEFSKQEKHQQKVRLQIINVHSAMKNWQQVQKKSQELLTKYPKLTEAQIMNAVSYHMSGQSQRAISIYKKLMEGANKQSSGIIANNLASLLADNKLELEYAEKLANESFTKLRIPHSLDTLAWVYYQQGRYKESKKLLKRILPLLPKSAYANYHYALHMIRENKKQEAKRYINKALELSDDAFQHYQECKKYLEELNK
ncbi:tetratricopeptide repeat protein [Candidatus Uabimicrobium amorphum]|uniref:Tetratricopeptide repeat protein n=1 Tax=Uabimicrobium amorphum TaxID=2596890 RepID=A0A5S9F1L4_UABAM|nr:tetratricopeptide repeat protein [Candidatus Uabimicrobium amorphum]BBM82538.1 hypothetical protein UABAM_00881 [Candidatus Uabimicrobium amorphum]